MKDKDFDNYLEEIDRKWKKVEFDEQKMLESARQSVQNVLQEHAENSNLGSEACRKQIAQDIVERLF